MMLGMPIYKSRITWKNLVSKNPEVGRTWSMITTDVTHCEDVRYLPMLYYGSSQLTYDCDSDWFKIFSVSMEVKVIVK